MTTPTAKEPEMAGLDAVREKLEAIVYEMAGIIPDPSAENPDWMLALGNSNTADAECLNKAYNAAREALALLASEHGEPGKRCSCEWEHPVDGSVDVRWPAELSTSCPVHGASAVFNADAILGTPTESTGGDDA